MENQIIKNKMDELKRYRESSDISQSLLTSLSRSPGTLQTIRRDTGYFTLGSLVDTLAFFGQDGFNELYHISNVKQPTDMMWDYHLCLLDCLLLEHSMEDAKEIAYTQSGIKLAKSTVERRYQEEVIPYLEEEVLHKGKILVQKKDVNQAKALVKALHSDPYVGHYFSKKNQFQVVVRGVINGVPCKGLIDILEIDEEAKTMRVVDLKTTSKPVYSFHKSILSYRYDLQVAFYSELLKQEPVSLGYTILEPRFVVINVTNLDPPIAFELSKTDLEVAKNGGIAYDGSKIKGYLELLSEYSYINGTSGTYYKEYVDNQGVIKLNIYGGNLEI